MVATLSPACDELYQIPFIADRYVPLTALARSMTRFLTSFANFWTYFSVLPPVGVDLASQTLAAPLQVGPLLPVTLGLGTLTRRPQDCRFVSPPSIGFEFDAFVPW